MSQDEVSAALREAIAAQEKILRCYQDPQSRLAQWTRAEIARLRALLAEAERTRQATDGTGHQGEAPDA